MGSYTEMPSVLTAEGLWGDTQFSDATIICGKTTWKVHRWVICRQSGYFMLALEGGFLESVEKKIVLSHYEPEEVEAMLKFLYTGSLQPIHIDNPLEALLIAGCFQIESLRAAALEALAKQVLSYIDT